MRLFRHLFAQLDRIERKCDQILVNLAREENRLMALIDDVLVDVQDLPTLDASLKQFLDNLQKQLADALANGDVTKITQIQQAIDAHKQRIVDDIQANTPPTP